MPARMRKWAQFCINGSLTVDLYSNTTDRFTSVRGADPLDQGAGDHCGGA